MTRVQISLVLYFASEVFLSLGIGAVGYAQPFFYAWNGLSDASIGLIFALNSVCGGLYGLLLGAAADKIGASRVFKFATLILPAGYVWMALSSSFGKLALSSCVTGIAGAMLMSTENVVLSSLTRGQDKASVLSRFVAMYMFVMAVGAVVSGVVSAHFGYRSAMLAGASTALIAPIIRVFVRAKDAKSGTLFRRPSKTIIAMSLFTLLVGFATGIFNPFATLVLRDWFGMTNSTTTAVASMVLLMTAIGSFTVTFLLRYFRHGRTLLLSFSLAVAITVTMAFTGNGAAFLVLYLGRTVLLGVPGSIVDAMFLDLTHETSYAQMFGVRVFGSNVGTGLGQYTGGLVLDFHRLQLVLVLSAVLLVMAYTYLVLLLKRLNRRHDGQKQSPEDLQSSLINEN